MKYYLIRDKQGNIVIQNFDFDVDSPMCTKTTISKLKKHFRLIHYLESDLKLAECKKESYSNYLNEYLEVVEVEVELEVKIKEKLNQEQKKNLDEEWDLAEFLQVYGVKRKR